MDCENSYQVKILSKQLNSKKFSTFSTTTNVTTNPWFWSGLIDAEGSFSILINRSQTHKLKWRVQTKFQMGLHERDLYLLLQFRQFLGGIGSIHSTKIMVNYSIDSIKDLNYLITHLEKYPLLTPKAADFILFKEAIKLINNKSYLSIEGLNQIINIKASMNLGLSDLLKSEFNSYKPVERPFINTETADNWIAGFVSGEGNLDVKITQQSSNKIGYRVQLRLRISQHERDTKLMESIIKHLGTVPRRGENYTNIQGNLLLLLQYLIFQI